MKPAIPDIELTRLIGRVSIPAKTLPAEKLSSIWEAVLTLKTWMPAKRSEGDPILADVMRLAAWEELSNLLASAVRDCDPRAFDELSKAWAQWKDFYPAESLEGPSFKLEGFQTIRASARLQSVEILTSILHLQQRNGRRRAPTRQEILAFINEGNERRWKAEGRRTKCRHISDRALSKQLDKLGLTGRIATEWD